MNRIPTATHGILDYVTAGTLLALPRFMKCNEKTSQLLTGAGLGTLAYSLMTRYELGAVRAIPMKGHLALDAASAALFCAAPFLNPDEDSSVAAMLVGIGVFEFVVTVSSETESPLEKSG